MKKKQPSQPVRVGLVSLGCAKNLVDAEIILGSLLQDGIEITNDVAQADAIIVNTCSFIDAAQEESVDTILETAAAREARHRGQALIVSGCLPQRFREELPRLLPEVDAFLGIDEVTQVGDIVRQALTRRTAIPRDDLGAPIRSPKHAVSAQLAEIGASRSARETEKPQNLRGTGQFGRTKTILTFPERPAATAAALPPVAVTPRPKFIPDFATPRYRLTPRHFAYVKIAEGCNHPCSFCIIPRIRGPHRSRPQADIMQEARQLVAEGVKELNLISQDTTYYGRDLALGRRRFTLTAERLPAASPALPVESVNLCTLLRELNSLPGDFWIRLLYTHPAHWTDDLINTLADCPKVARYVDIPLQHIHPVMLERMRRETSPEYIRHLIQRIRMRVPGITLRTTFLVGFPGETDTCFQTLLEFIRDTRFERLGVFTYSQEQGTPAARMERQIPDRVKQERRDVAMAAQHQIAREVAAAQVGRTLKVLVERRAGREEWGGARTFSWEHGALREADTAVPAETRRPKSRSRYPNEDGRVARSEADAPDIDGRVYVRGRLPAGEFAYVRVTGHTDYDLIAERA